MRFPDGLVYLRSTRHRCSADRPFISDSAVALFLLLRAFPFFSIAAAAAARRGDDKLGKAGRPLPPSLPRLFYILFGLHERASSSARPGGGSSSKGEAAIRPDYHPPCWMSLLNPRRSRVRVLGGSPGLSAGKGRPSIEPECSSSARSAALIGATRLLRCFEMGRLSFWRCIQRILRQQLSARICVVIGEFHPAVEDVPFNRSLYG